MEGETWITRRLQLHWQNVMRGNILVRRIFLQKAATERERESVRVRERALMCSSGLLSPSSGVAHEAYYNLLQSVFIHSPSLWPSWHHTHAQKWPVQKQQRTFKAATANWICYSENEQASHRPLKVSYHRSIIYTAQGSCIYHPIIQGCITKYYL